MCSDIGIEPSLPRRCRFIVSMYLQTLHLHITAALFLFHFWTICSLRWNLALAHISKMLFLVSHLYHRSWYLYLWRSALLRSHHWLKCTRRTFHRGNVSKVSYTAGGWNGNRNSTNTDRLVYRRLQRMHASTMFPNVRALLTIICTLPVTSCSAERSFSAVKRLKTAVRSSMGTERLTGLALLHIHRNIHLEIPDIVEEFARRHPRRLKLSNILVD